MDETPPTGFEIPWGKEQKAEPVEVDQRALIDKILARYSTKFPVLRELLQNADDAKAKHAFIRFETKSFTEGTSVGSSHSPNLESDVHRWTIHNDGEMFSAADWNRLKTIADGNPDEHKIGAFGVGFYSVFKITNEPSVKSGRNRMRFHWGRRAMKQLFVSRSIQTSKPAAPLNKWTTFELPLITPRPLPGTLADIGRFLAASLPFMVNLKVVTVAFDSHTVLRLRKSSEDPSDVPLLKHLRPTKDPGLMEVISVNQTKVYINAHQWFHTSGFCTGLSSASPPLQYSASTLSSATSMLLWTAEVKVTLDDTSKLKVGLDRAIKKPVPKLCRFQLIYTRSNDTTNEIDQDPSCLFESLRQNSNGEAYVHIGHTTTQTTGIGGPVAARFIPTVERELIDFEDEDVKTWNEGLLYVGGYLARTIYEHEMHFAKENPDQHMQGVHALQFFTFHQSTPHACVSDNTRDAFFGCSSSSLPILSSVGVLPACEVRDFDVTCDGFVKKIPMLEKSIATNVTKIVDILREKKIVKPMGFEDLMQELSPERILTEQEVTSCLMWVAGDALTLELGQENIQSFLDAAQFMWDGSCRTLSSIETFVDQSFIPSPSRLPDHTLPYSISRKLPLLKRLAEKFSWKELSFIDWLTNLTYIPDDSTLILDQESAEQVFSVLGDTSIWKSISEEDKKRVRETLGKVACIPTSKGMKRPDESYLRDTATSKFLDLPMVDFRKGSMKEPSQEVLLHLRVRERIDLIPLLEVAERRSDALHYFVENYKHYRAEYEKEAHKEKISHMKFIPAVDSEGTSRMARVSETFTDQRCLSMGFLVIADPFRFEAAKLKLSPHPPTSQLLSNLKDRPPTNRKAAKLYFEYLSSLASSQFTSEEISDLSSTSFVPVFDTAGNVHMEAPKNCYLGQPNSSLYSQLFTFVDFDNLANSFLESCMARRTPEVNDIATILAQDPQRFLSLVGNMHQYMQELVKIAENRSKETIKILENAPILLGSPYNSYAIRHRYLDGDETISFATDLLRPSQVVVIDDARYYNLFKDVELLYHAPKHLEPFYLELGCERISLIVKEIYLPKERVLDGPWSTSMRDKVLERLQLFIRELDNHEMNERYMWMKEEGHFQVKEYRTLSVNRELHFGGVVKPCSCDTSAGYFSDDNSFELLLKRDLDYFDIACCISKLFFKTPTSHVYVLLMTLLSTPLEILHQRGYNVELPGPSFIPVSNRVHLNDFNREGASLGGQETLNSTITMEKKTLYDRLMVKLRNSSSDTPIKMEDIDRDIESVITSEARTSLLSASSIMVSLRKEDTNKYCGGSKYCRKLNPICKKEDLYEVYVGQGVSDKDLSLKHSCIECFVKKIIKPLQDIYHFPPDTIRVLYDPRCSTLTAFNRGGKIYLNLGVFERDSYDYDCRTITNEPVALLSWYFTLAHEFAHNVVPTHNANFEFICSRICQRYALSLFKLGPLLEAVYLDEY